MSCLASRSASPHCPARFSSSDYNVLLVAEKYQTGFDQPLLQAMYVDKRLDGVQAVQTLSRLNRTAAGKQAPFVLDFVNDPEDVRLAFKPYYDRTQLQEEADPYRLEELKHQLDQMQVYHWNEVEVFAQAFFSASPSAAKSVHAQLVGLLQPTVERFRELDDEGQKEISRPLAGVRESLLVPEPDHSLRRPRLRANLRVRSRASFRLFARTERTPWTLAKKLSLSITASQSSPQGRSRSLRAHPSTSAVPLRWAPQIQKKNGHRCRRIIEKLNERFGTEFTETDRLSSLTKSK